jgi:hypothetical protein
MPETDQEKSNLSLTRRIKDSNITRALGVLALVLAYYFLLSPYTEGFLTKAFGNVARETSNVEVNSLSPIFDIHVYAGEYNLSSVKSANEPIREARFFTLDPRVLAMSKFLSDYHSPMAPYAEIFIIEADRYGLDWRLVASISGVESAFGNLLPQGSHNAWGWRGIKKNDAGWSIFDDWEESITHVTERLALGYGTDLTPFDIQDTYCPPCGETGLDLWAHGVTRFMNELEYYVDNLENL